MSSKGSSSKQARSSSISSQRSSISQLATNTSKLSLADNRAAPPTVASREALRESDEEDEQEHTPESSPPNQDTMDTAPDVTVRGNTFKAKDPERFDGSPDKFKGFIIQLELYIRLQPAAFPNNTTRVLFAANCLQGKALTWFEPMLNSFFAKGNEAPLRVRQIFSSFEEFKKELRTFCGVQDAAKEAERKIQGLKQQTSVAHYASQFRSVAVHLGWDDSAMAFVFFQGLKQEVRERYIDKEKPDKLNALIEDAIKIDNRIQEFRQDNGKKNHIPYYGRNQANTSHPRRTKGFYPAGGTMSMDLDMGHKKRQTNKKFVKKGPLSQSERDRRMKNNLCLYCGESGHSARDCPKKGNSTKRQFNMAEPKKVTFDESAGERRITAHAELSWTECTRQTCMIHRAAKDQAGIYPTKRLRPRRDSTPMPTNRALQCVDGPKVETPTLDNGRIEVTGWTDIWIHGQTHFYSEEWCDGQYCTDQDAQHQHPRYGTNAPRQEIPVMVRFKQCFDAKCVANHPSKYIHFHENEDLTGTTIEVDSDTEEKPVQPTIQNSEVWYSDSEELEEYSASEQSSQEPEEIPDKLIIDETCNPFMASADFNCIWGSDCKYQAAYAHTHMCHYDPRNMSQPMRRKEAVTAPQCQYPECPFRASLGLHLHWSKNE